MRAPLKKIEKMLESSQKLVRVYTQMNNPKEKAYWQGYTHGLGDVLKMITKPKKAVVNG